MSTLIILGNTNQFTFANSIVAAHSKAIELFKEPVKDIFIIHSSDSYNKTLYTIKEENLYKPPEWIKHLKDNGIEVNKLIHRVIDLDTTSESVDDFVHYIESIINGFLVHNSNVIVDLTNSTTLYKNLLSNVAYILDFQYQYVIDTRELSKRTEERGFLPLAILRAAYVPLPESTKLDNITYLNLTEMVRYKKIIQKQTEKYAQIDTVASDKKFFEDNLTHSVQLKLQGDRKKDNAIYRIVASSIAASVEDLVTLLINRFSLTTNPINEGPWTFGKKVGLIQSRLAGKTPSDFDFEFFKKFNDFMLYLRNSSTHKSTTLADIERFKADLSVKMSFPFIELYADIIYPLLTSSDYTEPPKKMKKLTGSDITPGVTYYFGLDGDDTGTMLEELFMSALDETAFEKMSKMVSNAIQAMEGHISSKAGKVIFAAGDNILFKADFDEAGLRKLQELYKSKTSGLTCSIGYGKTFREVYFALKLAKLELGKNSIVGIEFV